ncbi:pyruvate dehydrogenase (acetyl-transferring), homodimeric type, partial [Paenarthrobacter sp. YAF11_1]
TLPHPRLHQPRRENLASTNPAVKTYDPAYGYEIGHIIRHGLEEMYGPDTEGTDAEAASDKNVMYYLTVYNEPITQPAEPENLDINGLLKGIYHLAEAPAGEENRPTAAILASGVSVPWA